MLSSSATEIIRTGNYSLAAKLEFGRTA